MLTFSVLILDDDGRRRESIGKMLRTLPQPSQILLDVCEHDSQKWTGKGPSGECCLLLVHWKNRGVLESDLKPILRKSTHVVPYSGGGLHVDKVKSDKVIVELGKACLVSPIWDSVDSGESFSQEKWMKLVKHAIDGKADVPDLLQVKVVLELIPALSLLCQGYLAHYALKNRLNGGVDTKGCIAVAKALHEMGWVEDEAATVISQTVENFALSPSESLPDADFWQSPFDGGKSLREGLEEECRVLRKNVEGNIQNGTLEWPDDALLPTRINRLVNAIKGGKVSDDQFVSVVARAYNDLNLLLEAV